MASKLITIIFGATIPNFIFLCPLNNVFMSLYVIKLLLKVISMLNKILI